MCHQQVSTVSNILRMEAMISFLTKVVMMTMIVAMMMKKSVVGINRLSCYVFWICLLTNKYLKYESFELGDQLGRDVMLRHLIKSSMLDGVMIHEYQIVVQS